MATPRGQANKPSTRSSSKKAEGNGIIGSPGDASPILQPASRKRKISVGQNLPEEPQLKRMADNQILEAINGIKTSVSAMEQQLKTVPSKSDLGAIVTELRGVRESVIRNTDRIDTLYDLRKKDGEILAKRVEQLVEGKLTAQPDLRRNSRPGGSENERSFLRSRRSVRIWPVQEAGGLEKGVRTFLTDCLKIPSNVVGSLVFERVERQSQARRSKIKGEVLVMLESSQQRDVIQSYAANPVSYTHLTLPTTPYV